MIARRSCLLVALLVTACGDDGTSPLTNATATTATTSPTTSPTTTTGTPTSAGTDDPTGGAATGTTTDDTGGPTGTTDDTGGTSTTGGGGAGGFCQEACDDDGDCLIDGLDQGYVCNDGRCRPGGTPSECTSDLFCQTVIAGLLNFCESSDECSAGRACVKLDGYSQGSCPQLFDVMGGCPDNYEAVTLPLLEGGEAEVCVAQGVFCDKVGGFQQLFYCNAVPEPCQSDAECEQYPNQPVCGGDGACVCTTDAHCADLVGHAWCVDGRCACKSDQDCAGLTGADTCVDGLCGCGSPAVCPTETAFDGTEYVCEPL